MNIDFYSNISIFIQTSLCAMLCHAMSHSLQFLLNVVVVVFFCLSSHFKRPNISLSWKLFGFLSLSLSLLLNASRSTEHTFCVCLLDKCTTTSTLMKKRINVLRFYAINLGNNAFRLFYIYRSAQNLFFRFSVCFIEIESFDFKTKPSMGWCVCVRVYFVAFVHFRICYFSKLCCSKCMCVAFVYLDSLSTWTQQTKRENSLCFELKQY